MSPGYKTTEFYLSLAKILGSFATAMAVLFGYMQPDDANLLLDNLMGVVMAVITIYLSGRTAHTYIASRTAVKMEEAKFITQEPKVDGQ